MEKASNDKGTDRKNEIVDETTSTKMIDPDVSKTTIQTIPENSKTDPRERDSLRNFGASLLKRYNYHKDVKKAVESGNMEEYCKKLTKRLEKVATTKGLQVVERCKEFNEQTLKFLLEEKKRKEHGGNEDDTTFISKFHSLPDPVKRLVKEARSVGDIEQLYQCVKTVIDEDLTAFEEKTKEEAQSIADQVLQAAKFMTYVKRQEDESQSASSMMEEATKSTDKDGRDDPGNTESHEKSEKAPTTEQEGECVIPTPPPPPPVKSPPLDRKDEMNNHFLKCRKQQVELVKKELNFSIARLTSEVITSYEQATALRKCGSSLLHKSILDFLQNQETKKTFFIKEILTCLHKILDVLTPEPETDDTNAELLDLNETVKLLYLLQKSKTYHVDGVAVTRATYDKIGVLYYALLIVGLLVVALALCFNGEWLSLSVFAVVVLVFIVKAWQAVISIKKKRVEVFGRVKSREKID